MPNLILRLDVGDSVIDRSTAILRKSTGAQVVTPSNMPYKVAEVGPGETLLINAHGDSTTCGGYTASQLAAFLAQKGLRSGVNIEIIACETGFGGAPFALELKTQLVQGHKITCSVSAPTRYVAVGDNGQRQVLDATFGQNGQVTSVTPVPTGTQLVNTPWGTRKVNKSTQDQT